MQDAVRVGVVQRSGQLLEDADNVAELHRTADAVFQRPSFDQLEDEVRQAFLISEVEDLQDVGVLETSH